MTHCDNGHPEILHYETECPLCAAIAHHAQTTAVLEDKIIRLKGDVESAQIERDEARMEKEEFRHERDC